MLRSSLAFFLILISSVVSLADGSVKIFKCQSEHSLFDPDFSQGSESFINIYYNPNTKKTRLQSVPSVGKPVDILTLDENTQTRFELDHSVARFQWSQENSKPVLNMVYLGAFWGMAIKVSQSMAERDPELSDKRELELRCEETARFHELVVGS